MASTDDCIRSGEVALNALYALQTAAMKSGNLAAQKALSDDINNLNYNLTQLQCQQIADNDTKINALNSQLDQVTKTAQNAINNLDQLTTVLQNVVTATRILDGILQAAVIL